ncbi:MAG: HrgA protein, partial [Campylobacter sp.]|nr:HrgA protein [Campylobacter sp.]
LLTYFVSSNQNFECYTKTIYHEKSSKNKKGMDKWLYPDIVGVKFKNYSKNLVKFSDKFNFSVPKIYSFEIKINLSVGNFREYFFQTVSNSSWANESYLIALDIDVKDEELNELISKLSSSFGIGVISLDTKNLDQSEILAPAKFRDSLDLVIMDELCRKNGDFNNFIKTISEFQYENKVRYKDEFDEIYELEELESYMSKKGIL